MKLFARCRGGSGGYRRFRESGSRSKLINAKTLVPSQAIQNKYHPLFSLLFPFSLPSIKHCNRITTSFRDCVHEWNNLQDVLDPRSDAHTDTEGPAPPPYFLFSCTTFGFPSVGLDQCSSLPNLARSVFDNDQADTDIEFSSGDDHNSKTAVPASFVEASCNIQLRYRNDPIYLSTREMHHQNSAPTDL